MRGEERTFAGLGVAGKTCLGQGQEHRLLLTPGSAGTPALGADTENPQPGGRRAHPFDGSSVPVSVSLAAGRRMRGQRPRHPVRPAPRAAGPRTSPFCPPQWGENGHPERGSRHSTESGAGNWAGNRGGRAAGWPAALPGHTVVQAVFWKAWPSQKAPPLSGAGLVQVRVRFCQPRPQRLEQGDHSAQLDQPPFTARAAGVTCRAWPCELWAP